MIVVKEFFSFCGKITQFQMKLTPSGDSYEAVLAFEKDSSARTAKMLSNAVIGEKSIQVRALFSETESRTGSPTKGKKEDTPERVSIADIDANLLNEETPQENADRAATSSQKVWMCYCFKFRSLEFLQKYLLLDISFLRM
jgi:hypothetical protein